MVSAAPPGQGSRSFQLWELAQSPYLERSRAAADAMSAQFVADGMPARTSTAPVRPLNSITVPAVAVEIAPLGKSADELSAADYQQKVAATLASAIAGLRARWEAAP